MRRPSWAGGGGGGGGTGIRGPQIGVGGGGRRGGVAGGVSDWGFRQRDNAYNQVGLRRDRQNEMLDQSGALYDEQHQHTKGVLGVMAQNDQNFLQQAEGHTAQYRQDRDARLGRWRGENDRLMGESQSQASDARKVYDQSILPNLKNNMEAAQREAAGAMTLQQAGDVNNDVHRSVRELYEKQAQGVGKQGLADAGVLQAMGAQATAGQMAGLGPMTGGQMQALMGANQSQAGMAYARAQQQMQRLREQGIDRGFSESAAQYDRGQRAKDRAQGTVLDLQNSQNSFYDQQARFRGEQGGYNDQRMGVDVGQARDDYGLSMGLSGMHRDFGQQQQGRELAALNQLYAGKQGVLGGQMQQVNAQQAATMGILGSMMQGGAQVVGGAMGGANGSAGSAPAGMQGGAQSQQAATGANLTQGYAGGGYYDSGVGSYEDYDSDEDYLPARGGGGSRPMPA